MGSCANADRHATVQDGQTILRKVLDQLYL